MAPDLIMSARTDPCLLRRKRDGRVHLERFAHNVAVGEVERTRGLDAFNLLAARAGIDIPVEPARAESEAAMRAA